MIATAGPPVLCAGVIRRALRRVCWSTISSSFRVRSVVNLFGGSLAYPLLDMFYT